MQLIFYCKLAVHCKSLYESCVIQSTSGAQNNLKLDSGRQQGVLGGVEGSGAASVDVGMLSITSAPFSGAS